MLGYQKLRILSSLQPFSDQVVGWFCCEPGLHHIANFVRMEGCSQLVKKIAVLTFSIV